MPAAYTIMAEVVDGYAKAAADVESDLEELEEQVFNEGTTEDHRRIYEIRKDIGRIDRAVSSIAAALRESTQHLETLKVGSDEIVPYLHDLLDDAAGTAALINNQSRALDAILSSHENNVAARQNQDMRTISAFAALLALPTLIAGPLRHELQEHPARAMAVRLARRRRRDRRRRRRDLHHVQATPLAVRPVAPEKRFLSSPFSG